MLKHTIKTTDDTQIRYQVSRTNKDKPWLVLIMPFGMKLELTLPFFEFFQTDYRVLSWEGRLVFEKNLRNVTPDNVSVDKHVSDLLTLMDTTGIHQAQLVGYCSGAGVALKAVAHAPARFEKLVLVHGEYTMLSRPDCVTQAGKDVDSLLPLASMDFEKSKFILNKLPVPKNIGTSSIPEGVLQPYSDPDIFYRYANSYLGYKSQDYLAIAGKIEHECHVLSSEIDQQTNLRSSLEIAAVLKNAAVLIDSSADHYGILREGSTTLENIKSVLSSEGLRKTG